MHFIPHKEQGKYCTSIVNHYLNSLYLLFFDVKRLVVVY